MVHFGSKDGDGATDETAEAQWKVVQLALAKQWQVSAGFMARELLKSGGRVGFTIQQEDTLLATD